MSGSPDRSRATADVVTSVAGIGVPYVVWTISLPEYVIRFDFVAVTGFEPVTLPL